MALSARFETGCVAFLRKPFSQYALVDAIGKAVA
jgi:FixJ family two-component response regulator